MQKKNVLSFERDYRPCIVFVVVVVHLPCEIHAVKNVSNKVSLKTHWIPTVDYDIIFIIAHIAVYFFLSF